ncbi:MAPK/MAK/MRK overlapping kinase [Patella vulgata]|uniref:MAPK/MAK/MRK overlapping kinase n=1 Tax=Patella vulgata TaxID=6465 RepID=UPI00217F269F|nr:MAPK/MAK/MRK overlapping kinase [Patella vulgata]
MNLLLQKYRIIGKKGEGTFSEVLKCQNIKDGGYWACKKMKQTYDSMEQVNNLREIQAMRKLNPHINVLELEEVIFDKKSGTLVLVCELMDMNIYELIRGKRHYLQEKKVKNYMYQLLKSIDHMHRNGIFHRDVKPENILIKDDLLKLADFGSCRSVYSKQPYTEYISTRWYRAPECLLTDGFYTYKMDMWSVGCVFFEVLSLHPLFPGSNEVDQIAKIHDIMGTPDPSVLKKLRRSRGMNFNFPPKKGSGIERLLPHATEDSIALIYLMCTYDPDDRLTARQALKHPYFKELRDADKRVHMMKVRQQEQEEKKKSEHDKNTNPGNEERIPIKQEERERPDPEPPQKNKMTEITMYPSIPKPHSLPPHNYMYKKRRKNKRYQSSQQYSNHTGLFPRVEIHPTTYHTVYNGYPGNKYKYNGNIGSTLLPSVNNGYKPHKAAGKPNKAMYGQYTLPSLDPRF